MLIVTVPDEMGEGYNIKTHPTDKSLVMLDLNKGNYKLEYLKKALEEIEKFNGKGAKENDEHLEGVHVP
jgi:hypothetical protein